MPAMIRRSLLLLLLFFFSAVLNAQEMCIFTDLTRTKNLPGWEELQGFLFPGLPPETEKKLQKQGIDLKITRSGLLLCNDLFELTLHGLTEDQLEDLLEKKLLHPEWSWKKENGIFLIKTGDDTSLQARPCRDGICFSNGSVTQKDLRSYQLRENLVIQGLFLCSGSRNPILTDVSRIYFYVYDTPGKFTADLFIKGKSPQADKRVFNDLSAYFARLYTNAATQMELKAEHLSMFRVEPVDGWTKLRVTLPPDMAKEFFAIFCSTLKDLFPEQD